MKLRTFRLPFGTSSESVARGDHTHGDLEPADPTILREADIGVTVQPYDPNILTASDIGDSVAPASLGRIVKSVSQNRSSVTTPAADADLIASLFGVKKYMVRGIVFFSAANATMDLKYSVKYGGGTTETLARVQKHLVPGSSTEQIILS